MRKTIILTLLLISLMLLFIGCGNRQFFDTYTFDTAIIQLGNETKIYKIQKWKDFDGDQLQVILEDGTVGASSCNLLLLLVTNKTRYCA